MKPSFKNTGKYSTTVSLGKLSGCVVSAQCDCKAGAGGCCKHVAALLYNILDYVELGLGDIPADKSCTDQPQRWNKPKGAEPTAPVLFSEIQFVHHAYGKRKAEDYALRVSKIKRFRACPPTCGLVSEEKIRKFCTSLEANNNAKLFTSVMRNNDCKPTSVTCNYAAILKDSNSQPPNQEKSRNQLPDEEQSNNESPEAKVWNKVNVTKEQAEHIEIITRAQADSANGIKSEVLE